MSQLPPLFEGRRIPGTAPGTWTGVYMVIGPDTTNSGYRTASFIDGMDGVGVAFTYEQAMKELQRFELKGFTDKMTDEDMQMTAGVKRGEPFALSPFSLKIARLMQNVA